MGRDRCTSPAGRKYSAETGSPGTRTVRRTASPALTSALHDSARDLLAAELGTSPLRRA